MSKASLSMILKLTALFIVDVIVFFIIVSYFRAITSILFPTVILFMFIALVLLHTSVLGYGMVANKCGNVAATVFVSSSSVYFIAVMTLSLSGLPIVLGRGYVVICCVMSLFLVLINSILIVKYNQPQKEYIVQMRKTEIKQILFQTENVISEMKKNDTSEKFMEVYNRFYRVKERIESSTPFGYLTNNLIMEKEERIKAMFNDLVYLLEKKDDSNNYENRIAECNSILEKIYSEILMKEKLIIK